jgi:hypothetical protein
MGASARLGYREDLNCDKSSTSIVVPRPVKLYEFIDRPKIKSEKVLNSVGCLSLAFGLCGTIPLPLGIAISVFYMLPPDLFFVIFWFQVFSAPLATVLGLFSTRRLTGQAGLFLGIVGILLLLFIRLVLVHEVG